MYLTFCFITFCLLCQAQVTTLKPGAKAPDIQLTNIDDKIVSLTDFAQAKGFIIVFTCNTCPYSKRYEQRVIALNERYAGLGFPVIAVNPNSAEVLPGESFAAMKKHAADNGFTFPYLFDKDQQVTTAFGPRSTPTVFVITKTSEGNIIAYSGAIDNDAANTNPNKISYVEEAVNALLNNKLPAISETKAIGCSISWKKKE